LKPSLIPGCGFVLTRLALVDGSIITGAKSGYSTDMIQRYLGNHLEQLVTDGRAIYPSRWILSCCTPPYCFIALPVTHPADR
jgi:hypothetical protein